MPFQPRVAILVPAPDYYEKWQGAFARKAAALTAAGLIVEQRVWADPGDLAGYDLILPLFAWGMLIVSSQLVARPMATAVATFRGVWQTIRGKNGTPPA